MIKLSINSVILANRSLRISLFGHEISRFSTERFRYFGNQLYQKLEKIFWMKRIDCSRNQNEDLGRCLFTMISALTATDSFN